MIGRYDSKVKFWLVDMILKLCFDWSGSQKLLSVGGDVEFPVIPGHLGDWSDGVEVRQWNNFESNALKFSFFYCRLIGSAAQIWQVLDQVQSRGIWSTSSSPSVFSATSCTDSVIISTTADSEEEQILSPDSYLLLISKDISYFSCEV